ncbi:MAG: hypothetical protein P1U86_11725 [Verrucomicrobiales bacterium]|nr:hypothetical protein [Verrucomicrobiales bacterium]
MKHRIGIIGLVVGLIALGLAIFQDALRPQPPEPTLKEVASEAGKKFLTEKFLSPESDSQPIAEPRVVALYDGVDLTYMILGFIAMILGIFSWVKKDHIRISGGAISLGLMAVAWQYVLIGVAIAVVILIIANFGA